MTTDTETELSFADKLDKAYRLALHIGFSDTRCTSVRSDHELERGGVTKTLDDEVWALIDGLTHKYHEKHMSGQCSLQAAIDYDIGAEEVKLDGLIAEFQRLIKQNSWEVN